MAKKISLINMKGGVGKSTLTVNLGWCFASLLGKKVLVVDLDPQFNASQYLLGVTEYEKILRANKPTIWHIFEQNIRTPVGKTVLSDPHEAIQNVTGIVSGRLDLVPSRLELALSLRNPGQKEMQLPAFIAQVEGEYDMILIDCAPTESVLTTAAYLSSDYLLVPVKPEYLSAIGLPLLVNSLLEFRDNHPARNLELAGIVFNHATDYVPEEERSKQEVRQIASQNNWHVSDAEVPYSRSFPKGAREGRPIFSTSHARGKKVGRFIAFAAEFGRRINLL